MPEEIIQENLEQNITPETISTPETIISPENAVETKIEQVDLDQEKKQPTERQGEVVLPQTRTIIKTPQQIREEQIDLILSDGLSDIYLKLSPTTQQQFAREGTETVKKINEALSKPKVTLKRIVELIRKWLSLIPGVNKFFLEQEVKIKADKIIKLRS